VKRFVGFSIGVLLLAAALYFGMEGNAPFGGFLAGAGGVWLISEIADWRRSRRAKTSQDEDRD
jgi:hypothetical protein